MKVIRFGIIGCGWMGREFAGAVARWCTFTEMDARPRIIAICNRTLSPERINWFTENFDTIEQITDDYTELLANPDVDAVYVAVPHHLHSEIYCAALKAGKHLLGEKPFGMDLKANNAILNGSRAARKCRVGCASQFVFYPAAQRILRMIEQRAFGRIIEVDSGFQHCSDLNPEKPINWKRMKKYNGPYGVIGDLGPHIVLMTIRAGWKIRNTRAICSNIMPKRPNAKGGMTTCDTWDNATILSQVRDPSDGSLFPWTLRTQRIMPGEKNTWYINIYGTEGCARFSLKNPKRLELLKYTPGAEQLWQNIDVGFDTSYQTITSPNFEFGALDSVMQMIAAFVYEISHGIPLSRIAACPTPAEMNKCHKLFTAALESHKTASTVSL